MDDEGRRRAARAVTVELSRRGWEPSQLADTAKVDRDTVYDFLRSLRWPRAGTRGRLEGALGWPPGQIGAIADGDIAAETLVAAQEPNPARHATDQQLADEVLRRLRATGEQAPPRAHGE